MGIVHATCRLTGLGDFENEVISFVCREIERDPAARVGELE